MQRKINDIVGIKRKKCYFNISKLLRSKSLPRKLKSTLYTSYFRQITTNACETWSTTEEDNRNTIWERKMLRKILGQVYNSDLRVYETRHNEKLYCLYGKPNILTYVRYKWLEWLGYVGRSNADALKNFLTEKINMRWPLRRQKTIWRDIVEKDIRLVDKNATMNWMLQDRERLAIEWQCRSLSDR